MRHIFAAVGSIMLIGAAPAPVSLYGVEFGAPLSVPKCARSGFEPEEAMCYVASSGTGFQGIADSQTIRIVFARGQRPSISEQPWFLATLIDGKTESIYIVTAGAKAQSEVIEQLTAKFGEPTTREVKSAQNGFGAKFEYAFVQWDVQGTVVAFSGISSKITQGSINATTAKFRDAFEASKRNSSEPKL